MYTYTNYTNNDQLSGAARLYSVSMKLYYWYNSYRSRWNNNTIYLETIIHPCDHTLLLWPKRGEEGVKHKFACFLYFGILAKKHLDGKWNMEQISDVLKSLIPLKDTFYSPFLSLIVYVLEYTTQNAPELLS